MRPNKVNGLTVFQRSRMCTSKQRWSDEMAAQAGAASCVERGTADRLYVYKCPECHGYHLTKRVQFNKPAINQQFLTGEEEQNDKTKKQNKAARRSPPPERG